MTEPSEDVRTCLTCPRPLEDDEPRICSRCHIRARHQLMDVVDLYAALPDNLAVLTGATFSNHGIRSTAETPVVGGDALVMAASGNNGSVTSSRRGDRSHALDQWPTDPPSIAAVLGAWEDTFRAYRNERPAPTDPTVTSASDYLLGHLRWATFELEDWEDFARDVQQLRSRLKAVTGDSDRPERTQARCFDCDSWIVRPWTDSGLSDEWVCDGCGREYEEHTYMLAIRHHQGLVVREERDAGFVTPTLASEMIRRSERTIREWMRRGELEIRDRAGHRFVRWDDVVRMNNTAGRRVRSA